MDQGEAIHKIEGDCVTAAKLLNRKIDKKVSFNLQETNRNRSHFSRMMKARMTNLKDQIEIERKFLK